MSVLPLTVAYWALYRFCFNEEGVDGLAKRKVKFSLLILIAAHIGFVAMLAAPTFPARATFGMITFLIIALSILYAHSNIHIKRFKFINKRLVMMILCVLFIFVFCQRLYYISYMSDSIADRLLYLNEQKQQGNFDIEFASSIVLPKEYHFDDLSTDSIAGRNREYARFYDIQSVRVCPSLNNE